MVYSGRSLH
jgi:hypothetical protein